jgi:hypothetical protein
MWNHNEVTEETNLLASYVGTKTEDESDSANLVLIDFFNREVIDCFAALSQRGPNHPQK